MLDTVSPKNSLSGLLHTSSITLFGASLTFSLDRFHLFERLDHRLELPRRRRARVQHRDGDACSFAVHARDSHVPAILVRVRVVPTTDLFFEFLELLGRDSAQV